MQRYFPGDRELGRRSTSTASATFSSSFSRGRRLVSTEEDERELAAGEAAIIAKGRRRKISAGRERRSLSIGSSTPAPLQISRAPERDG